MKLKRIFFLCAGLLVLSNSSQAGPQVPFKARFHGFAETVTPSKNNPDVLEIVIPLQGLGTHLGRFDERLVHFLNKNTGAFTGYAEWTAADGDTFITVFVGQLYSTSDPNVVSFEVTHTIVSGTGRFSNATGTFKGLNGHYDFVTGEDYGEYLGTISFH